MDLRVPRAMTDLVSRYASARPDVLEAALAHVFGIGAQTVAIEHRYIDLDYRNEHSRFYSGTFRRYPSVTHRLHFFASPLPAKMEDPATPATFPAAEYLGYLVVRPVPGAPVGRTFVRAGANLESHVGCISNDRVNLYGRDLSVPGAPFMAQDAQLTVCAHASVWMAAYHHHLRFGSRRPLPGDIADAAATALGLGRPVPSGGLNALQISEAVRVLGLPCVAYNLRRLPKGEDVFSLICRYLNSSMPVIIGGGGHAFTLIGYQQYVGIDGSKKIRFIRQDDEVGPYQLIDDPNLDTYSPWDYVIVPLPSKIYVSGESAELLGRARLRLTLSALGRPGDRALLDGFDRRSLRVRTSLIRSNEFKVGLTRRGLDESTSEMYRRIPMPRWIWVIEATLAAERDRGEQCVVAEAVIDATDHLRDLRVLAWRVPGRLYRWLPDEDDYLVYGDLQEDRAMTCVAAVSQKVVS
ncbi:MAG TPA: hypothetical protein VND96_17090 [Candidatus Micrarchaeaceae archaeon]|nr:hypothetical protein [Candidatus Micrarchaeaceae archaeon]